jgi:nicotinamide phosphoribosyltransferase
LNKSKEKPLTYTPVAPAQTDAYKLSHKKFEAAGTTKIYANFTARSGKYAKWGPVEHRVVVAGIQAFVKNVLIGEWNESFFNKPFKSVIATWKARVEGYLGAGSVSMKHFEALHKLGYLPIKLKALPEGSKVPFKVAFLTITNTHPDFSWLVTYLETVLSQEVWPIVTNATVAYQFYKLGERFADETCGNRDHLPFQFHDFSARGMFGRHAAAMSGFAHLVAGHCGTDTVAALDYIDQLYGNSPEGTFIAASVPASEHSVTSLGIAVDGELETIKRWITKDYPSGIVSVVSDTLDYWQVLTTYLPALESEIRARQPLGPLPAKVVVRPDSGDPIRIICGYREDEIVRAESGIYSREDWVKPQLHDFHLKALTEDEVKGSIQVLYEKFGGTINTNGYIVLDPCIGLIYGDSITLERADEIFRRLQSKGFASSNVVFGVGSYTYQMVSRDTYGMAVKATYAEVATSAGVQSLELFKDPKTDDGTKKSARGLICVYKGSDGELKQSDQVSPEEEQAGLLRTVFEDGKILIDESFATIRARVQA